MLENAKLVRLKIRQFGNTRQDEAITDEVTTDKHLGNGAGKWVKAKLPESFLKPAKKYAGLIRQWHYSLTCPWDEGVRLLGDAALIRYRSELDTHAERYGEIVADVDYPAAIEAAREIHNGTFDTADYPNVEQFRKAFALSIEYLPVPRSEQLIVKGLGEEAIADMRASLERHNEERLSVAVENVWARLLEPVQALAARLSDPEAVFRDSLVGNVQDILARVDSLNITGNTQLSHAARAIQENLAQLNPERLRNDRVERREVAERAQRILSQFGAMGARKFAQESEAA